MLKINKKVIRAGLMLLLICTAGAISAQDFQFIAFADYYGGIEPELGYENLRSRVFMRPTIMGYDDSTGLEWQISANLWAQPIGNASAINPWDILHETYIFVPAQFFDFTIGQKIVTYGFADIFGPINALHSANRRSFSIDDSYDSRRPDPLVQFRFYPSFEDTIELTYIPLTRPDRERYDDVYLPKTQDTVVWSDQPYIIDPAHSIFINYNRYGEKMDLQLFYGWYTEQTPDFIIPEINSATPVEIKPVYNRKHSLGVAYSARLGSGTFSQDFGLSLSSDIDGTDPGAQNSDITVNTQYLMTLPGNILAQFSIVYSHFINHGNHDGGADSTAADYLAEQVQAFHTQPLQNIAFIVGHFEKSFLREKLKAQLNIGFFFSPEMLFTPRLSYAISDYWSIETGADITLGTPPETDLRRNPANDNFYIRMLYRY